MYKNCVIIPALNPPENLVEYIDNLIQHGIDRILVIDDGSREDRKYIFDKIDEYKQTTILKHAINLGKGRALKNAFNYVLTHWGDDIVGVITVDSDGQHTVQDVIQLQKELFRQSEPALILGVRDFDDKDVPIKSKFGNKTTSLIFKMLYGAKIKDTQTGLRAIPKEYMREYLDLKGERFEYEMNMLIHAAIHHQKIDQTVIETVYFDNNSETHFRPFVDSYKIYKVILKGFFGYILSSVSASVIDLLMFGLLIFAFGSMEKTMAIFMATVIARIVSSLYNFAINRNSVFKSKGNMLKEAIKYYILCIAQMLFSAACVVFVDKIFSGTAVIEKVVVDIVLFLISYRIQRMWVFKGEK